MRNKSKVHTYPESKNCLKINSKITSKHNKTVRNWNASSDMSPLSLKTYAWLLVSKLTTCVTSLDSIERSFFFLIVFSSLSPCWFFIRGGKCCRPIILHTVQEYFWRARQGQTQYVWWGQTVESGLRCWAQHLIKVWGGRATKSSPHHCQDAGLHSYVGVWYWTDQTHQI